MTAHSTIAEQKKKIAELKAERDNWERTAVSAEEQLIGAEANAKRIAELEAERDRALRFREHTEQWYAERLEPIRDVAKRVGVWDEVAAIIANGSGTRQVGGKYIYEPPTYAQQLNAAKYRAETAETALTTERQRREEAEAIVTLTCDLDRPFGRAAVEQARVRYFAKYGASNG